MPYKDKLKDELVFSREDALRLAVLLPVVALSGTGMCLYQLWHDWQHHRIVWIHLGGLLAGVYLLGLFCKAVCRAWKAVRNNNKTTPQLAPKVR